LIACATSSDHEDKTDIQHRERMGGEQSGNVLLMRHATGTWGGDGIQRRGRSHTHCGADTGWGARIGKDSASLPSAKNPMAFGTEYEKRGLCGDQG